MLRSLYRRAPLPPLLLLDTLREGLLLRLLRPLRRPFRSPRGEFIRLGLLDRDRERGEIDRRGERDLDGVSDRSTARLADRVRVRPREGDLDGIDDCERVDSRR